MIDLNTIKHAHFLGIGGIGVSAVARMVLQRGATVSGSDVKESSITLALREEGARVVIGHAADNLDPAPDVVVHSTAVPPDNIELVEAARRGIPIVHRSELLAGLMASTESIGVTGTHGKGTVSSMLTRALDAAGREPGFCIGGMLLDYQLNARWGGGEVLVAEVDESDGSHLKVRPDHLVIHFIELDHLNYYDDFDDILRNAVEYVVRNPQAKTVALNVGCEGVRKLVDRIDRETVTYAFDAPDVQADWHGTLTSATARSVSFDVSRHGEAMGSVSLRIPGEHNAENALAAIAVAVEGFGVPFDVAASGVGDFGGLENRFTIVDVAGVTLVKDYLSHPTGMRKVLKAARRLADGRLVVVYKPYRFTLLRYLGDEYAEAFEAADHVVLTDMYAAGEDPIEGIGDDYLVRKCLDRGLLVTHVPGTEDIPGFLDRYIKPGDIVALFGGDDFFRMADAYAEHLREAEPS